MTWTVTCVVCKADLISDPESHQCRCAVCDCPIHVPRDAASLCPKDAGFPVGQVDSYRVLLAKPRLLPAPTIADWVAKARR